MQKRFNSTGWYNVHVVDIDMLLSFRRSCHRVMSRASTISCCGSMRVGSTRPHRFSIASPPRKTCVTGVWLVAALEAPAVTDTSPSTTATAAICIVAIACGRGSMTLHRSRREQAGFRRAAQNESTDRFPNDIYIPGISYGSIRKGTPGKSGCLHFT